MEYRTDLNGAEVIESLILYKNYGEPLYENNSLIGSAGLHPDRLHTMAEITNLRIKTILPYDGVGGGKKAKNGSWNGNVGMLTRKDADVVTVGLAWNLARDTVIDYVDDLKMPLGGYTLIGQKSRQKALDMWVYVGVFGLRQWAMIVAGLMTILLITLLTSSLINHETKVNLSERAITDFEMVFSFVIQLGHQPQGDPITRRMIYLITGIMTYFVYAYYTTDITSQMTHRETVNNPFNSFDDVVKNMDVRIITVKGTTWESAIMSAVPGTAKHEVYKDRMENNNVWFTTIEDAKDAVLSDPNTYLYGYHTAALSPPGLKALKMVDMSVVSVGMGLQKNSEFHDIFNYLMIKLAEVGILKRINMKWPDTSRNEDFGIPEPVSLRFNNVLFPFTLLLCGILTASATACLEYLLQYTGNRL